MICDGSHDTFCLDDIGVPDPVSNFQTQDISEAPHWKKTCSLLKTSAFSVHVTETYIAMRIINALYRRIFRLFNMSHQFQMMFRILPKADGASLILHLTSAEVSGTVLTKKIKSSTLALTFHLRILTLLWLYFNCFLHEF